jgi:hypothetical protein
MRSSILLSAYIIAKSINTHPINTITLLVLWSILIIFFIMDIQELSNKSK